MNEQRILQGRLITPGDVDLIRSLLNENPGWHRTRLSRELCERWSWKNGVGRPKDMACRTLLLKLERLGEITLPPRRGASVNGFRNKNIPRVSYEQTPITGRLKQLLPLRVVPVETEPDRRLWATLLNEHHYLGYSGSVGENLKYLIRDQSDRPLSCLLFGAAAWKAGARDEFIGWDKAAREQGLPLIANNMRFLVLPWIRVPHLASHILSRVSRRISSDWQQRYAHAIYLLETFVERDRFRGTCYQAANWHRVGQTQGRSRNDRRHKLKVPVKDIYVYSLTRRFRRYLIPD